VGHRGVEERLLDRGEVGSAVPVVLDGGRQSRPAVELAVGPAEGVPAVRRNGEVPQDALAGAVVVES